MKRLNKKGFTLVELLAVIVILALIMAIAIYSISGILQSSRENVFKETALNIINGVKMQLTASNELKAGKYYFTAGLLDNNNDLPFGGKIRYGTVTTTGDTPNVVYGTNNVIGREVTSDREITSTNCTQTTPSYVLVTYDNTKYVFSICLTPNKIESTSQKYIYGTEASLFGNTTPTVFPVTLSGATG